MHKLNVSYTDNPPPEDINVLYKVLTQQAFEKRQLPPITHWGFFLRDDLNIIQGGITGCLLHGCLVIDTLAINPAFQKQGYGTKLMQLAEYIGQQHACTFSTVNTMDWEAKDFYEKLGYQVEFQRPGYLNNSIFYFLRKNLDFQ